MQRGGEYIDYINGEEFPATRNDGPIRLSVFSSTTGIQIGFVAYYADRYSRERVPAYVLDAIAPREAHSQIQRQRKGLIYRVDTGLGFRV